MPGYRFPTNSKIEIPMLGYERVADTAVGVDPFGSPEHPKYFNIIPQLCNLYGFPSKKGKGFGRPCEVANVPLAVVSFALPSPRLSGCNRLRLSCLLWQPSAPLDVYLN